MSRHANPVETTIHTCQFCNRWLALRASTLQGKRIAARQQGWLASQALGMMFTCPDCARRNLHKQRRSYQNGRGKLWSAFKALEKKGVDVVSTWQQWLDEESYNSCRTRRPAHLNPWDAEGNILKPIRLDIGEANADTALIQNTLVEFGLQIDHIDGHNIYIAQ